MRAKFYTSSTMWVVSEFLGKGNGSNTSKTIFNYHDDRLDELLIQMGFNGEFSFLQYVGNNTVKCCCENQEGTTNCTLKFENGDRLTKGKSVTVIQENTTKVFDVSVESNKVSAELSSYNTKTEDAEFVYNAYDRTKLNVIFVANGMRTEINVLYPRAINGNPEINEYFFVPAINDYLMTSKNLGGIDELYKALQIASTSLDLVQYPLVDIRVISKKGKLSQAIVLRNGQLELFVRTTDESRTVLNYTTEKCKRENSDVILSTHNGKYTLTLNDLDHDDVNALDISKKIEDAEAGIEEEKKFSKMLVYKETVSE